MTVAHNKPVSIAILAMGGQGGGVLTEWIVTAGEKDNMIVQSTSIPGVAQRTGATIYYLEVYPRHLAEQKQQEPVLALMPVPGEVDIVIAGEIIEAGRAMIRGYVSNDKTTLISSAHRDYAIREKMAMSDGRVDDEHIRNMAEQRSKHFLCFDMADTAEQAGSTISAVLLGALAGANVLAIGRTAFEEAISASGIAIESNLKGFAAGFTAASEPQTHEDNVSITTARENLTVSTAIQALLQRVANEFPETVREMLTHGIRRLVDYQSVNYAHEYLDKIKKITAVDTEANQDLSRACARHTALWMSYEDAIRVADLKIRELRFQRVRDEVNATQEQIVYVCEYMHPRVEEICDILPATLGALILKTPPLYKCIHLFCMRGRCVSSNKLSGFFLLYFIAGLQKHRSKSLRYKIEQQRINTWLTEIAALASTDYDLALELTNCQQLIKGYGDTHARGISNYNKILASLEKAQQKSNPAHYIRSLREAALADEHGDTLDNLLNQAA